MYQWSFYEADGETPRIPTEDEIIADMGEGCRKLYPSFVARFHAESHDDSSHMALWRAEIERQGETRPFRFEDLNGRPEPDSWGPLYPKTASAKIESWRALERRRPLSEGERCAYGADVGAWINSLNRPKKAPGTLPTGSNCASGQTGTFSAKKLRAKHIAELHAEAARERREWADGKKGLWGRTIRQAYAEAMKAKREREASERLPIAA